MLLIHIKIVATYGFEFSGLNKQNSHWAKNCTERVAELKQENREISDLRNVLAVLVENTAMHTNSIFRELLEHLLDMLNNRLKLEEKHLFPVL